MGKQGAVVVGSGIMGRDIAAIFAAAGWPVQIVARNEASWAAVRHGVAQSARQIGATQVQDIALRRQPAEVDWQGVAIVVEAVPENLALKRALFAELDALAPPEVVMGSNTSSIRITHIAEGLAGAGRMANAHFFQPAHLVPLVELAKGEQTSDATMDALHTIFKDLGRAPVRIQRDIPGFLANRIQHALMREAFHMIDEGIASAEDVDTAVQYGFGFRYAAIGPMLLKELSGLDTQHAAATAIYPSLCNDGTPGKTLAGLVAEGRFGMKSGHGFWEWTDEAMARERQRYEAALLQAAAILGPPRGTAGGAPDGTTPP